MGVHIYPKQKLRTDKSKGLNSQKWLLEEVDRGKNRVKM